MQDYRALIDNLRSCPQETKTLEFKVNFSDFEKEGKDISALANSAAYIDANAAYKIWGIDDSTHEVVGTAFNPRSKKKNNQPLELWLRQHLSDNANFEFIETTYDNKQVVILKIFPAITHPVKFEDIAYIRTNSSTQKLKTGSSRETELWRKIQNVNFEDQRAKQNLTVSDIIELLNTNAYFDTLGIPRPSSDDALIHYLQTDGMITIQDDGLYTITNLGAILLAKNLATFPTVRRKALRIIRYAGKGRTGLRTERDFEAGYALVLDDAYTFIDGAASPAEGVEGAKRTNARMFPNLAVRELVTNALIHQDFTITGAGPMVEIFDDRIEFTNPGAPLVDTERIVNDPPRSRNEALSAIMRRFGFCEEAGSGWDKIISGCEEMHLPAPKIETRNNTSMRVTLQAAKSFKNLTPTERLDACYWHTCVLYENNEYATNKSLRERFDVKESNSAQISRLIKEAVSAGIIKPVEPNTSPRYMQYEPGWV
jgi:predicted HTH transcriptional regulator